MIRATSTITPARPTLPRWLIAVAGVYAAVAASAITSVLAAAGTHSRLASAASTDWLWVCAVTAAAVTAAVVVAVGAGAIVDDHADR